ncbi:chloride channel protein [Nostoc sp. 'Peltigera membranacea cyanobiont' 213]|uniref:chloride channel protein n=1 Tax=unclassified Nostoc TaxID=2593658 RepID=UPI000B9564AD|nr:MULTISPECIES: chloride channel protein [unclassified Nostoc]AVH66383.1 voltage-gated chloride channel protein [Nostoc sp. 'Peltigera membranacea cyanobiont' N6]OYD89190.1 chloride channel protein [Nostoc sp. 'Peltigera membranacea cyanobiont' 213]
MFAKGKILWLRLSRQMLRPRRLAFVEACLIGLVSGLAAVLLGQAVDWAGAWRVHLSYLWPAYLVLPGIGLVGGILAGWLVERFAPEASGSGMSEVKAVLARVPMPLNLRIALVKLVSATLVLGSGMPLGREGPTVQIGAALANQLSNWVPTSPEHRRQLIAAGAGAGLAAAFNAPIAGVLFVVEELLQDVSGITLGTAILASFIASVISRLYGSHSLDLNHLNLGFSSHTTFFAQEIPFYLILGVLAGLLGILFNKSILASLAINRRLLNLSLPWRIGIVGLVTGVVIALLPITFRNNAGLREILLVGSGDWLFAAIAFLVQFILIILTYGSGAPGGLLVPTLALGSALGYLVGATEQSLLGMSAATTYAHVGMAAFFSAVSKVPITAVVIVFEMTTDFNLVLPLMIVSVIAYLVAEKIDSRSLYDLLLEWKGIHITKEPSTEGLLAQISAADVMQRRVETLSSQMSTDEAMQAFSDSHHRNFPILENGKVVGIITQKDLVSLASQHLGGDTPISEIMTPEPVTISPTATLAHVLHILNRYHLSCLPVTEGRKLIGIITRSDIIRVEAEKLSGNTQQIESKSVPSYVIYQTRAPATGKGRLLLPLSHPQTAETLLQMAVAIAKERNYEIECLQVIIVPSNRIPSETPVQITKSLELLQRAILLGEKWRIPVHTQIRVTHNVAGAILESVKERHIDLVLMGWKGSTSTPGRVFSRVVDTIIRQASCDVVLAKLHDKRAFDRWLLPMAGGPNSSQAIKLLPALTSLSTSPQIKLCQVFHPTGSIPDTTLLEKSVHFLQRRVKGKVVATPVQANSVSEAVLECAKQDNSDVIVLGASRESLLQQAIQGNIAENISRKSSCTVIMVKT